MNKDVDPTAHVHHGKQQARARLLPDATSNNTYHHSAHKKHKPKPKVVSSQVGRVVFHFSAACAFANHLFELIIPSFSRLDISTQIHSSLLL